MSASPVVDPPLPVFRFHVEVTGDSLTGAPGLGPAAVCAGAFAECTGLEAIMEPKVVKEGGRNYGVAQRAGPVTFATVVLRRGMTSTRDLWTWFALVTAGGAYAHRRAATIQVYAADGTPALAWRLARALPVKFKAADLNARGTEVAVEELHLAHEGFTLVGGGPTLSAPASVSVSASVSGSASASVGFP